MAVIADASVPLGAPPLPGPRIVQKNEWLLWPPPLLRTPPRIASGTLQRSAIRALTSSAASAGWSFSSVVRVVDVGLVVLGVMDLHRPRIDVRLEGVVGVGKFRKFVSHMC